MPIRHLSIQFACRLIAIIFMGQILLGAFLAIAENSAKPIDMKPAQSITLHISSDGTYDNVIETISVPLVDQPGYFFKDRVADANRDLKRSGIYETHFNLESTDRPIGLFLGWSYTVKEVSVNGYIVKPQTQFDAWGETTGFSPVSYSFSEDILKTGENTLSVKVYGTIVKRMPVFHIGDISDVMQAQAWGKIFATDLVGVSIALMVFTVLLCFIINWPHSDRSRINALIVLLILWSLRNLIILGFDRYLPGPMSWWAYNAISYCLTFALFDFALAWTGYFPALRRHRWHVYAALLIVPAILSATGLTYWNITDLGWIIDMGLIFIFCPLIIAIFAWSFARKKEKDSVELILFIICASALLVDALDDVFDLKIPFTDDLFLTFYFAPLCGMFLALGMCASIATQASRARSVVMNINETLRVKLAERENEIRKQAKTRAIVDERRRIMRDMHDGLGASLSGIILRTRSRDLAYEEVPRAVQSSLDELRLIVDSLDSAGDTLAIAMGAFRERVEDQFNSANITLHWEIDQDSSNAEYEANDVLQIFRILQEASSNIIKHSKAENVHISLRKNKVDMNYPYHILVRDDGRGFSAKGVRGNQGKGMQSMAFRAQRIGATFDVTSTEEGLSILLELPPAKE